MTSGPGRAYLSVRGVHRVDGEGLARAVERALVKIEGVHWAEVNPILAEVAVAFEDGSVGLDDLDGVLDGIEEAHGVHEEEFARAIPDHPLDDAPIRRGVFALAVDAAGFGVGMAGRLLRVPRIPLEIASAIPAIDSLAPVRRILEARPALETSTVLLNAALQGLAQGPLGLVVDASHRVTTISEMSARRRAFLNAEHHLHPGPRSARLTAVEDDERPLPLPDGLVDNYGSIASMASLVGSGATLGITREPRRAADILLVSAPRAARLGREGFASQVGRTLAGRGIIPMDPRVLRRLDRIDCVVLDAGTLTTGSFRISETVAVGRDLDPNSEAVIRSLFDPDHPETPAERDEWNLAPLDGWTGSWPRGARTRARELSGSHNKVLGLSDRGELVALVSAEPELYPAASQVVAATRLAGHHLVVAGAHSGVATLVSADRVMSGGEHLARSVRTMQADGHVVALVTSHPGAALRAADCGIGVLGPDDSHPPWGADLICFHLGEAASVIDATRLARVASRQAVAVGAAGSVGAGLFALSPLPGANRRAMTAFQLSTLAALGVGTWTGAQLPRRHVERDTRPVPWHNLETDRVLDALKSGPRGLAEAEARGRLHPERDVRRPGFASLFVSELRNPLSVILGAGAAVSAAVGSVVDATLIAGVIGVDAALDAAQRLRTEAEIDRLASAVSGGSARVLRDGVEVKADSGSLVPGDVIHLVAGDAVPADCRILDSSGLETDESALTGESLPIAKDPKPVEAAVPVADRSSMLYSGTAVAAGHGEAVVVATGRDTEARRGVGDIASSKTGVENRLRELTEKTVPIVLASGAGLTLNSLLRRRPVREAVASGVSLAAAAVPEGLPFVATVAQASAAHRLAQHGVLVRNPQVLEALGRVDVLCFDKTGTLTEGHLRLQRVSDGATDEPVGELGKGRRVVLAGALRATPRGRAGGLPHPTDQAVVEAAALEKVQLSEGAPGWHKAASLPFESVRAYHAVLGRTSNGQLLSVKGAPEVVLPRCSTWRRPGRRAEVFDEALREVAEQQVEQLARRELRVLAVAERPASDRGDLEDDRVGRLELLGFIGVADAARATASAPLEELARAGINVVMVTGDHPSTASAIATDLGLLNGRRVISGAELDDLDDEQLDGVVENVGVFARVTPADKVRIVRSFQRAGRVVAMTGDGANDAQAIRLAEIGVAFGPKATSAARDAADLVVARDDLNVLIDTIVEGRAMWASVRDALALLLGGNLGEVVFVAGAALANGQPPLNARQLLVVNLFTDLVPAMAVAAEPPRHRRIDLAREGPETSLSGQLARDVAIRAASTAGGAYAAWLAARLTGTRGRASTVALAGLIGAELGQTLVVGRRSPLVAGSTLLSSAGLVAIIQIPGVSQFFGCRPLGPVGWTIATTSAGLATAASVLASVLAK